MSTAPAPETGTTTAALTVSDVTVRFAGLTALDSVSFTVEPGSVHAVIGPNGAGRSRHLRALLKSVCPRSDRNGPLESRHPPQLPEQASTASAGPKRSAI
ncbi:ATP-binding cassette domain-containing protein [Streptomyces cyaneofuscatus]